MLCVGLSGGEEGITLFRSFFSSSKHRVAEQGLFVDSTAAAVEPVNHQIPSRSWLSGMAAVV